MMIVIPAVPIPFQECVHSNYIPCQARDSLGAIKALALRDEKHPFAWVECEKVECVKRLGVLALSGTV